MYDEITDSVKQIYLVKDVTTCDNLGPNVPAMRPILKGTDATAFVHPVTDLFKTLARELKCFTYHHGEHYVTL